MKKRRVKLSGFSLLELLIALGIFATCLLAVYGIFPMATKAVVQGENVFLANQVAKNEMEYLKTLSWDDLNMENTAVTDRPPTVLTVTSNGITHTTTFNSTIRVEPLADDPDNIKTVRVQISWIVGTPGGNKYNNIELQTLINNPKQ
ncbi:MAG: prepilin-type N-terminal cleavage/methylation domain-containing protein [Firmicutes bacterium]|nr:prepilin-type N-terminal cleavage/methylation domain-containing protein [Bacillota bacterium]